MAKKKATNKKPPAMTAAVRVTKKNIKPAKAVSKPASPQVQPVIAVSTSPENRCLADMQESQPVAARQPQNGKPVSEEEIRQRAYLKWEAAGRPAGDGANFWIEAQRELLQP